MKPEAETCRTYVVPALAAAGWSGDRVVEQYAFTDGRIVVTGAKGRRGERKVADYLLRYTADLPLAVVEAKAEYKRATDGLGQAKNYARILGVPFAYASNGPEIVEYDGLTHLTDVIDAYPTPDALLARTQTGRNLPAAALKALLAPDFPVPGKRPRYYQRIAINRAVEALARGQRRVLLTLATGTGKTTVAFQIAWKLTEARWTVGGAVRRPRVLFLADRDVLVGDPMTDDFAPFGDARWRIEANSLSVGRSVYFSTYQALAGGVGPPLYERFPADFFDLVIVDECHRGSAREDSVWREILHYFHPAAQLGMTATPLRDETRDTYEYFGAPVYTYSLRDGINDGFLAPYRVYRVVTDVDAVGWRPTPGERDRYGNEIPDDLYGTPDFERRVALRPRTEAIAAHLARYLEQTDPLAKTIVFCVDQEHASAMAIALGNRLPAMVARYPDYVERVTADEGDLGRTHLSHFQDIDMPSPVILTTSQLLTTGVDAPTCKNIVLARIVGSMVEFKQIIGRGTRVRADYDKWSFTIIDYTGSATQHFADPAFDGDPVSVERIEIDERGETVATTTLVEVPPGEQEGEADAVAGVGEVDVLAGGDDDEQRRRRTKWYVDRGTVSVAMQLDYELDANGDELQVVSLSDFTAGRVRTLVPSAAELRAVWADPVRRADLLSGLEEAGLAVEDLPTRLGQPDADAFDLLCHLAFGAPLRTRRDRASRVARERADFFAKYGPEARQILAELLDKYAQHGVSQLQLPDVLKLPPISRRGNPAEIARAFGGADKLRAAVADLQTLLYDDAA